jgi:hypothetical protein
MTARRAIIAVGLIFCAIVIIGISANSPGTVSSGSNRYAVSASNCEENLRDFRLKLNTIAKGSLATAESLEAVVEKMELDRLPGGYIARTEADLIAHGCH